MTTTEQIIAILRAYGTGEINRRQKLELLSVFFDIDIEAEMSNA